MAPRTSIVQRVRESDWSGPFAGLGFTLVVCAFAYWLGLRARPESTSIDGLYVAPECLDFGDVWEQRDFILRLPIENRTKQNIRIRAFISTCGCVDAEPKSMEVGPGAKETLRVKLNLSFRPADAASSANQEAVRDFTVEVAPRIRDDIGPVRAWCIHGRVRVALAIAPRSLNFGNRLVHETRHPTESLQVRPIVPISDLTAECDPAVASVRLQRRDGSSTYDLQVTPNLALPVGPFSIQVRLHPNDQDGHPLPTLTVPVEGRVLDEVQPFPLALQLGARQLGETATETISFQCLTGKAFKVRLEPIQPPSESLAVIPISESASTQPAYRVTQLIAIEGSQTATLTFKVTIDDHKATTVSLPVTYYGVASRATGTP